MVWSQYVYEASANTDVIPSDEEELEDEHSLLTECDFSDFAEFCYTEHTDDCDFVWFPYEFHLSYIWRHVDTYLEDTDLCHEFMVGATFDHWVRFVYEHTKQNNISV